MKIIFLILFNIVSLFAIAQSIDSTDIVFNAKLYTLSKHELISKEEIINKIDKIESKIYRIDEFYFIKIKNMIYTLQNSETRYSQEWSECYYYICYSTKKKVFYLLIGFENDMIKQFSKEFNNSNALLSDWENNLNQELINFLNNVVNDKYKKAKQALRICKETYPDKKY